MHTLFSDLRHALRMLRKRPGFTAVAVATLALGIGANTTIFTIINAVFLHPLPVHDVSTLVDVYTTDDLNVVGGARMLSVSYPNYQDLRDQNDVFSGLAASAYMSVTYRTDGGSEQVNGYMTSANYFDVLGVKPVLGRTFLPNEDEDGGGHPVAVISSSLWNRQFGASPTAIGRTITLNAQPFTVIGVAPPGFKGTFALGTPDQIWVTTSMHAQVLTGLGKQIFKLRRGIMLTVTGRLKPGVTIDRAQGTMRTIAARLAHEYPRDNGGRSVALAPVADGALDINQRGQFVLAGGVLMAIVGFVLLIACLNLANLLLARAAAREREMSIRVALGAGRFRLMRQLLTESLVLAFAGSVAGVLIAFWGLDVLWSFRPPYLPADAVHLDVDARVLGFTIAITLVTGLLFGLIPALRASKPDLNDTLKQGARQGASGWGSGGLRGALVLVQVAVALVAMIGAGLFVRSVQRAQQIATGFESTHLFVLGFGPDVEGYSEARGLQFYDDAVARARRVPGVASASIAAFQVLGGGQVRSIFPEGTAAAAGERGVFITTNSVSSDYFDTLRIPLVRGRVFTTFDRETSPLVTVVNEAMVTRFWPGQNPIGKRFTFFNDPSLREVVGVVRNSTIQQVGEEPREVAYFPMRQNYTGFASLQVRTTGHPEERLATVRQEVQAIDRNLMISGSATVSELMDQGLYGARMGAGLVTLFGAIALALASLGIYGLMSYSVSQRTREIGLRMALGAQASDVLRMVLRQGMTLTAAGVAIGLVAASLLARFVTGLLYDISATDPVTFVAIAALLAAIAFAACVIPARRAVRVDPLIALRGE